MTNNEAYWTERALKRAEEAYLHDAALTAKLFQEYESAAKAIKREISAFYSKYAGKYGLTYDQAVRLLNRKEFQEWKASLAEYVDYIATIQDPKVKALLTAQLDALSANSSISRLEALQGQIDLILNDLFDKGVAQMKNQFGDDFVEGYYKKCYDLQSRAGFFNEIAKIDYAGIENVVSLSLVRRHVFRSPMAEQTGASFQHQGSSDPGTYPGEKRERHVFRPGGQNGPVLQERRTPGQDRNRAYSRGIRSGRIQRSRRRTI